MCRLGRRLQGRCHARSTRAALASTLACALLWREAVRVPPRTATARSLPCSLDAGCVGFYAGARAFSLARVSPRAAATNLLPCSLNVGGAGSELARGGPYAIDIPSNHGFAGSSMLDTWLPQLRASYYERLWLRNAFKYQLHRSEFQTLVHRGPHQNLRPHGRNIPDKRSREGRNVLLHSHEREQPTLPRVDPVAYKDQNEIASRLTY